MSKNFFTGLGLTVFLSVMLISLFMESFDTALMWLAVCGLSFKAGSLAGSKMKKRGDDGKT